ncbi:MAG: hypothetical protein HUN04_22280 [Desulfobacter sp.]|nr:MAG: hypothetical protein HUN04_22280 [Desulfobacter sp.]
MNGAISYKKMIPIFLVSILLFFTTAGCLKNRYLTEWPPWELYPKPLESSLHAKLPQDIKIIAPSSTTPERIKMFSGSWHGSLGRRGGLDMKLAVEEIKKDGDIYVANVVYAIASERKKIEPTVYRLKGIFVDNELQIGLPGEKEMVFYRKGSRSWLINAKLVKIHGSWWAIGSLRKQE